MRIENYCKKKNKCCVALKVGYAVISTIFDVQSRVLTIDHFKYNCFVNMNILHHI